MLKKVLITIVVVGALVTVSVLVNDGSGDTDKYTTQVLERGMLSQIVDATGRIESNDRIELNFKITGQIRSMTADAGDRVTAGQQLARLDTLALESQVADARARVAQAQADLEKLLAGASATDIQVTEDTVRQREQDVSTAQNNLTTLRSTRDTTLSNLKETAITVMNNELATAQGALAEVNNVLEDEDAEDSLSIEDRSALSRARVNEAEANSAVDDVELLLTSTTLQSSDTDVLNALDDVRNAIYLVAAALADTLDTLVATITSQTLSEAELDALKSTVIAQQVKVNTAQNNLQSAKTNWTNSIADFEDRVVAQENRIQEALKALQVAESQLALKKSPPRQFEIDAARAQVTQAQASLTLARANLAEAIITAPLDGTVVKRNYEIGEQVSMSTPVFEMIGESKLQIEVDIPESDIAKVVTGQEVHITLDAFSDEEVFDGTLVFVDPAETIIQDVVYYKVKVQINNLDERLKPGMTANIMIITGERENVLWVPSRVVTTRDGVKYVTVLEDSVPVEKEVTTGIRGDQGIEILSGLEEGEHVITFVKE